LKVTLGEIVDVLFAIFKELKILVQKVNSSKNGQNIFLVIRITKIAQFYNIKDR
jgi:hypothetical protein